jgi:hypothetical protein
MLDRAEAIHATVAPILVEHFGAKQMQALGRKSVTMPDGSKRNNFINLDFQNFAITEKGDLKNIIRSQTHDDIDLREDEEDAAIPFSLRE